MAGRRGPLVLAQPLGELGVLLRALIVEVVVNGLVLQRGFVNQQATGVRGIEAQGHNTASEQR